MKGITPSTVIIIFFAYQLLKKDKDHKVTRKQV